MVCHTCFNETGTTPTCQFCGSSMTPAQAPYVYSQAQKRKGLLRTKFIRYYAASFAVFLVVLGVFVGVQHVSATQLLAKAKTQNAAFNYSDALQQLDKAQKKFVLPSVKNNIASLRGQTVAWKDFQETLQKSNDAIAVLDYALARQLLDQMPQDFPGKEEVTKKREVIANAETELQRVAAEKEAAEKAAAEEKAAAAAKTNTPTARKAQPKPTAPVSSGKKFVDTSAKNAVASATTIAAIEQALTTFLAQYGTKAKTTDMPQSIYGPDTTWALLDGGDVTMFKNLANNFIDEWAKYPVDFVQSTGLESVNFVKYVTVFGQQGTAMPGVAGDRRMWYGTGAGPAIVHHEFAHYFESIFFNTLSWNKDEWIQYNPPGFTYGAGGATAYGAAPKYAQYEHPISGFVTEYGTYGIEEDRAELFSYLMYKGYYSKLKTWIATDTLLQAKVAIYKNMLASKSASMSGSYFDDINR